MNQCLRQKFRVVIPKTLPKQIIRLALGFIQIFYSGECFLLLRVETLEGIVKFGPPHFQVFLYHVFVKHAGRC